MLNLGSFQPLFLWVLLRLTHFLLSFRDSSNTNVRLFVIIHRSLRILLIFFSIYFFCYSDWVNSIELSFSWLILSSVSFIWPLSPFIAFLSVMYFRSQISIWFFLLFLTETFMCLLRLFFHCFKHVLYLLIEVFLCWLL